MSLRQLLAAVALGLTLSGSMGCTHSGGLAALSPASFVPDFGGVPAQSEPELP